jgi:hypothetical protein
MVVGPQEVVTSCVVRSSYLMEVYSVVMSHCPGRCHLVGRFRYLGVVVRQVVVFH